MGESSARCAPPLTRRSVEAGSAVALPGGVMVRVTGRADGDLAWDAPGVEGRRAAVVGMPCTWLRQVHGSRVAIVGSPGAETGCEADAAVTTERGAALAVLTADCLPVALSGDWGAVAVAHAGWRGLAGGVLEAAVAALRATGAGRASAWIGPAIGPSCYPFGEDDLRVLTDSVGPDVVGRSADGGPAADLVAGARAILGRLGVDVVGGDDACTSCSDDLWSWRAARDTARQALVAWRA